MGSSSTTRTVAIDRSAPPPRYRDGGTLITGHSKDFTTPVSVAPPGPASPSAASTSAALSRSPLALASCAATVAAQLVLKAIACTCQRPPRKPESPGAAVATFGCGARAYIVWKLDAGAPVPVKSVGVPTVR